MSVSFNRTFLVLLSLAALFALAFFSSAIAQSPEGAQEPPTTWIDGDTGHRVWRLSSEPNSSGLYFNINAFTPDHKGMIYTAPDGIHVLDLATKKGRLVVDKKGLNQRITVLGAGLKTNSIFLIRSEPGNDPKDPAQRIRVLCKADVYTGEIVKLAPLPRGTADGIVEMSINADETLAAGTYAEGPPAAGSDYDPHDFKPSLDRDGKPLSGPLVQAANKEEMMKRRLEARIPTVLFTINLQTAQITPLLHTTDWINHLLFSPADPALLMYCHEGPWHRIDRIWFIHTDTAENTLIHKREMLMEIAGHEFWGLDGKTVWYDLQTPSGEDFWVAGYAPQTQQRIRYHLQPNEWSLHFNVTPDGSLFCGDGGEPGGNARTADRKWIELLRPVFKDSHGLDAEGLIRPGVFRSEHLVNMAKHDYRLEPNVRFTPDQKMVLFTSNAFGASYVFGVEVQKTTPATPPK